MHSPFILSVLSVLVKIASGQGNLELSNVKITTILNEPFMMLKDGCTKFSKDCAEGFIKDILDKISEAIGFQYTLKIVDDGKYGAHDGSKWTGMIGEVVDKKADMVAADLTMTQKRSEVLDFNMPYLTHSLAVLIKKLPDFSQRGAVGVLAAFDIVVWILTIVAVIIVVVVFLIIDYLSPCSGRQQAARGACAKEDADKFGLLGTLWFAFSNLCWQGFDRVPKSLSGRVMTVFWWIFVLFMLVSFTAGATNYLASAAKRANELPVNTLSELRNADDIKVGCFKGGSTYQFFKDTKTDEYRSLFVEMDKAENLFGTTKQALERAKKGKYGAILEGPAAEYYEARNCDLGILPERISNLEKPSSYAFALRPGLPNLLKAINKKIIQYQSDGIIFQLYQKWWIPTEGACEPKRKAVTRFNTSQTVGIGNVAVPFGILVLGIFLALITLALEIFANKLPCFKESTPASDEERGADAGAEKTEEGTTKDGTATDEGKVVSATSE